MKTRIAPPLIYFEIKDGEAQPTLSFPISAHLDIITKLVKNLSSLLLEREGTAPLVTSYLSFRTLMLNYMLFVHSLFTVKRFTKQRKNKTIKATFRRFDKRAQVFEKALVELMKKDNFEPTWITKWAADELSKMDTDLAYLSDLTLTSLMGQVSGKKQIKSTRSSFDWVNANSVNYPPLLFDSWFFEIDDLEPGSVVWKLITDERDRNGFVDIVFNFPFRPIRQFLKKMENISAGNLLSSLTIDEIEIFSVFDHLTGEKISISLDDDFMDLHLPNPLPLTLDGEKWARRRISPLEILNNETQFRFFARYRDGEIFRLLLPNIGQVVSVDDLPETKFFISRLETRHLAKPFLDNGLLIESPIFGTGKRSKVGKYYFAKNGRPFLSSEDKKLKDGSLWTTKDTLEDLDLFSQLAKESGLTGELSRMMGSLIDGTKKQVLRI